MLSRSEARTQDDWADSIKHYPIDYKSLRLSYDIFTVFSPYSGEGIFTMPR